MVTVVQTYNENGRGKFGLKIVMIWLEGEEMERKSMTN